MGNSMIENDYRHNATFRAFVQEYCTRNNLQLEEALEHEAVRRVWKMWTEV